ncbi:hypothetical protein GCM10008934_16310 [Virgibacillus salarius]|uniref:hypothetical protein n=1 Tax=Virgibacillus salarius TaxID=447199 RepID=UPI0031DFB6A2
MNVINNGKQITITCSFTEASVLVGAVQKGAFAYQLERAEEFAEEAFKMADKLQNPSVKLD